MAENNEDKLKISLSLIIIYCQTLSCHILNQLLDLNLMTFKGTFERFWEVLEEKIDSLLMSNEAVIMINKRGFLNQCGKLYDLPGKTVFVINKPFQALFEAEMFSCSQLFH